MVILKNAFDVRLKNQIIFLSEELISKPPIERNKILSTDNLTLFGFPDSFFLYESNPLYRLSMRVCLQDPSGSLFLNYI